MLLTVENLKKEFSGLVALKDVSFEVPEGGITGIIGPNGAGKTTLFNVISSILPLTGGRVVFDGKDITGLPCHRIAARGLVRTFQNVRLFKEMTVLENVLTGLHAHSAEDFWTASLHLPSSLERKMEKLRQVYRILDSLDLEKHINKLPLALPFGQRRLLEIARALAARPKLLLLDEPAAGLNRSETAALAKILHRINKSGITLLLVEHDMRLVMGIVDWLIVLDAGSIIARGKPEAVRQNPTVIRAYLGEEET